jgi:hypothetical protein
MILKTNQDMVYEYYEKVINIAFERGIEITGRFPFLSREK